MTTLMKRCLTTVALTCMAAACQASPWPLQILSSAAGWEASTNRTDWVPAVAVSNPITMPMVVTNRVNDQGQVIGTELLRDANMGSLMWAPDDANGVPPLQVQFRLRFTIDMLGSDFISIWFGADDYAEITLNGHALDTYLLDANMSNGQPVLHQLSLDQAHGLTTIGDPWGDGVGLNTLLIRARDGDASSAYRRGFSWVFVDGYNVGEVVNNQVVGLYGRSVVMVDANQVPEPQGVALVALALAALAITRRPRKVLAHRASGD